MAGRRSAIPTPGGAAVAAAGRASQPGFFNTAGGFLIGALLDVLFVQYMRGGFPQVRQWLAAKFLNEEAGKIIGKVPYRPGGSSGAGGGSGTPAPAPGHAAAGVSAAA